MTFRQIPGRKEGRFVQKYIQICNKEGLLYAFKFSHMKNYSFVVKKHTKLKFIYALIYAFTS